MLLSFVDQNSMNIYNQHLQTSALTIITQYALGQVFLLVDLRDFYFSDLVGVGVGVEVDVEGVEGASFELCCALFD